MPRTAGRLPTIDELTWDTAVLPDGRFAVRCHEYPSIKSGPCRTELDAKDQAITRAVAWLRNQDDLIDLQRGRPRPTH